MRRRSIGGSIVGRLDTRDDTSSYRVIRLVQTTKEPSTLRLSCGKEPRFLELKGMMVLLVGPQCQLRDNSGNLLTSSWGTVSPPHLQDGFMVLYSHTIDSNHTYFTTDNIQSSSIIFTLVSIISILVINLRRCCNKRQDKTHRGYVMTASSDPTQHLTNDDFLETAT